MNTSKRRGFDELERYETAQSCDDLLRLEREESKFERRWFINFKDRAASCIYQYLRLHPEALCDPDARFLYEIAKKQAFARRLLYFRGNEAEKRAALEKIYDEECACDKKTVEGYRGCTEWALELLREYRWYIERD